MPSSFGQVINRVGKIADFGHKYGKGFGKRAAHPFPIFLGVSPSAVRRLKQLPYPCRTKVETGLTIPRPGRRINAFEINSLVHDLCNLYNSRQSRRSFLNFSPLSVKFGGNFIKKRNTENFR